MIASIPSPSEGVLHIGPLALHAYGLCIALGVIAAISLTQRLWVRPGAPLHKAQDIITLASWGVPAGIIGSRIYHVVTDYELYTSHPLDALRIWDGGLGIWGGIACGVGVGLIVAHRRKLAKLDLMDCAAPGLAAAQGIGRFGNYFNQELFGGPSTLPWALKISPPNRPAGLEGFATFHPTFLYESLCDLAICGALLYLFVRKRDRLRHGQIFCLYVAGYTFCRFFIERMRIDFAHHVLGLRLNEWTSLIVFVIAVSWFFALRRRPLHPAPPAEEAADAS